MHKQSLPLIGETPRKSAAAQVRPEGEGDRKPLAGDWERLLGQAIDAAIRHANLTKQEVAYACGYKDQSALSRWISGVETPQFAKLFTVPKLRGPLAMAIAALAHEDVVIETTISIRRIA